MYPFAIPFEYILLYFLIGLENNIFTTAVNLFLVTEYTLVFSTQDAKSGPAALIRAAFGVSLWLSPVVSDLFQILTGKLFSLSP